MHGSYMKLLNRCAPTEIPESSAKALVSFLYSGVLTLCDDSVGDVMAAAVRLGIPSAVELCRQFTSRSKHPKDAFMTPLESISLLDSLVSEVIELKFCLVLWDETCFLVAGLQDPATSPGSCYRDVLSHKKCCRNMRSCK